MQDLFQILIPAIVFLLVIVSHVARAFKEVSAPAAPAPRPPARRPRPVPAKRDGFDEEPAERPAARRENLEEFLEDLGLRRQPAGTGDQEAAPPPIRRRRLPKPASVPEQPSTARVSPALTSSVAKAPPVVPASGRAPTAGHDGLTGRVTLAPGTSLFRAALYGMLLGPPKSLEDGSKRLL